MMQKKTCAFCSKPIENLKEANLFFAEYSHKSCDNKYFKEQEKRVKYVYKSQEERDGSISIKGVLDV